MSTELGIWLTPLLLLPGVGLLIMSTAARFDQLRGEFHRLEGEGGAGEAGPLERRARPDATRAHVPLRGRGGAQRGEPARGSARPGRTRSGVGDAAVRLPGHRRRDAGGGAAGARVGPVAGDRPAARRRARRET